MNSFSPIVWKDSHLHLLDQRLLPGEEVWLEYSRPAEVAGAISDMVVRGAPAIGITAAWGVVLAAQQYDADWPQAMRVDLQQLAASRPTAVNLVWALQRMQRVLDAVDGNPVAALEAEAAAIHAEDIAANHAMGDLGAGLIAPGQGVLTHCNTGSLATGGYGTALGVIRSAWGQERLSAVYAGETRPWLQGSRLTAWELARDHIPVTLVADSAAASLMAEGRIGWVILGADRVAANGDVVNKVGTYSLATLARAHGVKFMVVAPTSTIDPATGSGADIPVEQRSGDELLRIADRQIGMAGIDVWNPVFDRTPAALVDVLVTEKGVLENPDREAIAALLAS